MIEQSLEYFLKLETQVWQALVAGDMQADGALLTENFLGVYETGFAGRTEHMQQLKNGPAVASYELLDARILKLSADLVMLCYEAVYTRAGGKIESLTENMYVSSLWQRSGETWLNVFSQDTPVRQ